jgi:hypothetical protein
LRSRPITRACFEVITSSISFRRRSPVTAPPVSSWLRKRERQDAVTRLFPSVLLTAIGLRRMVLEAARSGASTPSAAAMTRSSWPRAASKQSRPCPGIRLTAVRVAKPQDLDTAFAAIAAALPDALLVPAYPRNQGSDRGLTGRFRIVLKSVPRKQALPRRSQTPAGPFHVCSGNVLCYNLPSEGDPTHNR